MPKKKTTKKTVAKATKVETPKVEVPKVAIPNKDRTEVLEAKIKELEAKIEEKRMEIAKEIPIPVTLEGETEGFKVPSLTTLKRVYTKAEVQRGIDAHKIANPVKYKRKVATGEFARKLKNAK